MTKCSTANDEDLVLKVLNRHSPAGGFPPAIIKGPGDNTYIGYYEDPSGTQWTLEIDRETRIGTIRCGKGWGERLTIAQDLMSGVLAGDQTRWEPVIIRDDHFAADFLLDPEELVWPCKAWQSKTGRRLPFGAINCESELACVPRHP